jgi:hypothetical protein
VLPHSAFRGQTPDEMYFGTGDAAPADLTSRAAAARRARVEANRSAACERPFDLTDDSGHRNTARWVSPQILFRVWSTFREQKWVNSREPRRFGEKPFTQHGRCRSVARRPLTQGSQLPDGFEGLASSVCRTEQRADWLTPQNSYRLPPMYGAAST